MNPDDLDRLRMAPLESVDEVARRTEHEQRAATRHRESELEQSTIAPFRVGSVPYLNAVPLTRGLESQLLFATPSRLAELLRRDELEAALVSVTEVLLSDRYDVLDEIAIASLGEVKSVFLAHRRPLAEVREVYYDTASLTSVHLLRVLLAEQGLRPELKPLANGAAAPRPDYFLLIGDAALDFQFAPHEHEIWDLGEAWTELTQLPFVYAVWALRRGVDNQRLRRLLREAKDFGMDTLDHIIQSRAEYDYNFRKDYLSWHIHYHLGSDEKRALVRFSELLQQHGLGPTNPPKFVV